MRFQFNFQRLSVRLQAALQYKESTLKVITIFNNLLLKGYFEDTLPILQAVIAVTPHSDASLRV
ncbi:hypothetical protein MNBD_GAMMA10-237 [hydrothermal vent metagenome]|uniref:Uncharacterized protein n=1 Tax=hydrothermal vent metagenome TaxID=652676 RepID=A0A3B0XK52_9ZZZZ